MFNNIEFKTVTSNSRSSSGGLVSIVHSKLGKKNEIIFRVSKEAMDLSGFLYGDKVVVQFGSDDGVCRITKSDNGGSVTLSKQVAKSDASAGVIRLTYKEGLPDFLKKESNIEMRNVVRVKYVHKEKMIEYNKVVGQVTFQLERDSFDKEKDDYI